MTIQDAITKFLEIYSARSKRSGISYHIGLNHFARWLDENTVPESLTSNQAREFAVWLAKEYRTEHGRPLAKSSLSLYLIALLKFYDFLIITDIIAGDNFLKNAEWVRHLIRHREQSPIEKKLPPADAVAALLAAVDELPDIPDSPDQERRRLVWLRDRAILYCLESSGARVGEIAGLRVGDLIKDDKGAWVKGKGDRVRFIRFSPEAWQRIDAYLKSREDRSKQTPLFCRHDRGAGTKLLPLTTLSIERTVNRLAGETGVLERFHLTPHSFRHYFATRFLQHTGDLALTQDVLGHVNPATTRIYAKTSKSQIIKAHSEIFDGD